MARASSPRRRLTREDRRTQLLTIAERVFAERGYQGASFEEIAVQAGVTRALIYTHFRSKDEIYMECLIAARTELERVLVAAAASAQGPEAQLRAAFTAYYEFVHQRAQAWDVLFGGGAAIAGTLAQEAAERRFQTAERVAALVSAAAPALPPGQAVAHAHALSGASEQLAKWWRRHPEVTIDEIVEHTMSVVWTGIERTLERLPPVG